MGVTFKTVIRLRQVYVFLTDLVTTGCLVKGVLFQDHISRLM